MNRTPLIVSLGASVLVVAVVGVALALGARPQLGLDLRGGISAVYTPVVEGERPEDFDAVLDETIEVIRDRVDALGVAEPDITRQGDDVLVQLPGLEDAGRAREVIGTTAQLSFRVVEEVLAPGDEGYGATPPCDEDQPPLPEDEAGLACQAEDQFAVDPETGQPQALKYRVGPEQLAGTAIEEAFATIDTGGWVVSLGLDGEGAEAFRAVTADLACDRDQGQLGLFAIVLDGRVESAPGVNPSVACGVGISGGQASITVGGGTAADEGEAEAQDLALVLRTGALPITLEPSTFQTVSPSLGAASLSSGLLAALVGLALVAAYLVFFYRWLGLVAIAALSVFGVLIVGLLTLLGEVGFALTLAGIAGIVVSIGITADSSILFFERVRDEVATGRTVRTSVQRAFTSAFRTNLAGNTVTLSAAVILYFLAAGSVRGFALTLGIATVLDIVILWAFTRPAVGLLSTSRVLSRSSLRVVPRREVA